MRRWGWVASLAAVLTRGGASSAGQVALDIDTPVKAVVPDLRQQRDYLEAGQIAYLAQPPGPVLGRFRTAIDTLATLVTAP